MIKSPEMPTPEMSADELSRKLLNLSEREIVCILDSCGSPDLDSQLMIAGIRPHSHIELTEDVPDRILDILNDRLTGVRPCIFTLSYDLGRKILGVPSRHLSDEPDLFIATFDSLIIHDYRSGGTTGADSMPRDLGQALFDANLGLEVSSNFSHTEYLNAIQTVKERIRSGDTYQTNLTHRLSARLPDGWSPQAAFARLRSEHPAPFAAFIRRDDSTVISASPERFFRIDADRRISTSPIKGTRHRGATPAEDDELRRDLVRSQKDIAENTMIVDLLRNDLGRVCEFGSVAVEKLCELEQHPTFFHLVSTVTGTLRADVRPSDILRAMFPCGSITGAPKISTMKIIDQIEKDSRGLSMGAVGCYIPEGYGIPPRLDLSVAIRTLVVRENAARFNVGGGITIDSDPENEWAETLTKSMALQNAIGGQFRE